MATYFLDPINGNDANDGTTFANRKKTIAAFTSAILAPGDVVRIMASVDPTSMGQSATWTNDSNTVTLTSAVTTNVDTCDAAWTASTNVTATASTTTKREGTGSANLVIATAFTTGKVAFKATGTLNLSAYQQVSLMIRASAALPASTLTVNLCTDTIGATSVHAVPIPALAAGVWTPVVFDNAAALNSAIASVSLNALLDPGAVTINIDNIIACKASSSADSLTHKSLIAKVHCLPWAASTAYSLNDKRRPTGANRNGFQYKVTTAGTTSGTEPTWPQELTATVTDGTVVWTCEELEDSWFPLAAINGTALSLASDGGTADNTTFKGYQGAAETVALYKREATLDNNTTSAATTTQNVIQDSGTAAGGFITYSGGWDRTAMTTQSGETWMDGRIGSGTMISASLKNWLSIENISGVRYNTGVSLSTNNSRVKNSHHVGHNTTSCIFTSSGSRIVLDNFAARRMSTPFSSTALTAVTINGRCIQCDSAIGSSYALNFGAGFCDINHLYFRGNSTSTTTGIGNTSGGCWLRIRNLVSANNAGSVINGGSGDIELLNPSFGEATPINGLTFANGQDGCVRINKYGKTAGDHRTYTEGGSWQSTTAQRHTASGLAWVFNPTAAVRGETYPLRMPIGRIPCSSGVAKSITIWTRRDATDIKGRLMVRGGQIAGVPSDTYVDCQPATNTWVQSSTLTFTPTEDGVVELEFLVWDGTGTTNSFWIDDLAVS